LAADDYWALQLNVKEIEVENVETVQNMPHNVNLDYDYDSPLLKVVRVATPRGICQKYAAKYAAYMHISPNSAFYPHILP